MPELDPFVLVVILTVFAIFVYLFSTFLKWKQRFQIDLQKILERDGADVAGAYRVMILDEDTGVLSAIVSGTRVAPVKGFEQLEEAYAFAANSTTMDDELTAFVFDAAGEVVGSFRSGKQI